MVKMKNVLGTTVFFVDWLNFLPSPSNLPDLLLHGYPVNTRHSLSIILALRRVLVFCYRLLHRQRRRLVLEA